MLFNSWKKHTPSVAERAQHSPVRVCVDCKKPESIATVENEETGEGPRCLGCTAKWMREYIETVKDARLDQAAD